MTAPKIKREYEMNQLWAKVFKSLTAPEGLPIQLDETEFQLNCCTEAMQWLADSQMAYSIIEYRVPKSYNVTFKSKDDAVLFKLTWC